jgi:hypothetical protein
MLCTLCTCCVALIRVSLPTHTLFAFSEYDRGMSLGDMADRGDIDSEGSDSDDSNEVRLSLPPSLSLSVSVSVCLFILC